MSRRIEQAEQRWFVSVELHVMTAPGPRGWVTGRPVHGPSEEMLQLVRERGIRTAVLASDRAFYGTELDHLVDLWVNCDTRDHVDITAQAAALPGRVVALTSLVDSFVGLAARAAFELGVSGPTPGSPALRRDKSVARQSLASAGVPDVAWAVCDAHESNIDSPIGYPCIAKPVDGASSWDVELVHDSAQTRALAGRHAARTYPRGVHAQHKLLFEEYVEGPLFSAEGVVGRDGKPQILGWSSRIMTDPPHFAELAITFSTEQPCPDANAFAGRVLEALGYDFGPFHLEFILGRDGLRLVELNARLVGSGAHFCLEQVLGTSAMELVVRHLLDEPWPLLRSDGAATQMYVVPEHDGVITAAPEIGPGWALAGLLAATMFVGPGDRVEAGARSSSDYIGWVISRGQDETESITRAKQAVAAVTPSTAVVRPARAERNSEYAHA